MVRIKKNKCMKRIRHGDILCLKNLLKFSFCLLFFTISIGFSYASNYAETTQITLKYKDIELSMLLKEIESQSEFSFFYNNDAINKSMIVSIDVEEKNIFDILDQAFKGTNITYKVKDKTVVLSYKKETVSNVVTGSNQQNTNKVSGIVTDASGEPLIGVSIQVKDGTEGTITDMNGNFSLNVSKGTTLVFSYVGYAPQQITVGNQAVINITLNEDVNQMEEVIVIGYGVTKKTSLSAAVSTLKGDDVAKNPVANLSNTFAGRVSGVIARQTNGEPGQDGSEIFIRGKATMGSAGPLVVIDGIPRSNYSQLDPHSIESVTVLKDAAAVAPYGLGGANGVILVTTKKGKTGKPTIQYNGYVGFQNATRLHEMVNSYEYALLMNEGARNSGMINMPYTDEDIANYKKTVDGAGGSHYDRYPNSRGLREIIDQNTPITNHSVEITGGSERVNYYISLAYLYQKGQFSQIKLDRYNVSSKLNIKATSTTDVSLSLTGYVQDQNYQGESSWNIIYRTTRTPPTSAIRYSNGLWGNYLVGSSVGFMEHSGYRKNDITQIYTTLEVEQQLPFLKGLSIKGTFSYDPRFDYKKEWKTPILSYTPDYSQDPIVFHETYNGEYSSLSEENRYDKKITMQGFITYKNTFGLHDISVLGVAERAEGLFNWNTLGRGGFPVDIDEMDFGSTAQGQVTNGGSSSRSAQVGFVYRVGYAYAGKYLAELAGRYDGHYSFAPGSRWGFFPSVSLAWNMAEEEFVKEKVPFMSQLKLRTSYGESGNLPADLTRDGNAHQFLAGYSVYSNAAYLGENTTGIKEMKQANPSITWERAKKFDIGFDAIFWNGKLSVTADYFYEKRDNMLIDPTTMVPVEYGIGLPKLNDGKMTNQGVELSLGSNLNINKDWNINLAGTMTFAKNKLEKGFETSTTYNNPNARRHGRPLDTYFGLKALGYFSENDFDADGKLKAGIPSIPGANVAPGDLKYADLSGPDGVPDGIIDDYDHTVIGRPKNTPQLIFGFSPTISWKNLDFSMLVQGATCYDSYIWGIAVNPFDNLSSVTKLLYKDHWTPENQDARYPRVTTQPLAHNTKNSSHWIRNTTYLRLKNIELGYTLPQQWVRKAAMSRVRIYCAGQNLLTWTPFVKEKIDPEAGDTNGNYYYLQSVFSFGANITF